MVDIAQLGIQIDSKTAIKAVGDLDDLALAAGRAQDATDDLGASSKKMTPALGGVAKGAAAVRNNSRMMAMQLSQVAQQTSATGNFVQALAIQLPDMAMGFGAVGIAAGILASVALPALASMFGSTEDAGKAMADTLSDMSSAVDAFVASSDAAAEPMGRLIEKYGRMADEAQRALAALAAADQLAAVDQIKTAIDEVTQSLLQTVTAREALVDGTATRQLIDEFGMLHSQARALESALGALESAKGLEAQVAAAMRVMNALDDARDSAGKLPPPLQTAYNAVAAIVPKAAEANSKIDQLAGLLRLAAGAADAAAASVSGIGNAASGAYGAVSSLTSKMWELAQAKAAAVAPGGLARSGDDGRGGQRKTVAGSRTVMPDQPWMDKGGGGGGGGGGSDSFMDDLKSLVEEQRSELEVLKAWYEEKQALLADARAKEYLGEQGHKEALIGLETEYMEKLRALQAETQGNRLGQMANFWGAMQSIAESGGKGMAKAAATFGAVEGTINAYRAALQALADPKIGFWGKAAAYASVLAAGLKGVAAIRSAGGIGGGKTAGAVPAQGATAAVAPQTRLIVQGIRMEDIITGEMLMNILGKEFGARNVAFVQ